MTESDIFDRLIAICPTLREAIEDDDTKTICRILTYMCGTRSNYSSSLSSVEHQAFNAFLKKVDEFSWKCLQAKLVAAYFPSFTESQIGLMPLDAALFAAWKNGIKEIDRSKYSSYIKGGLNMLVSSPLTFDSIYFPSSDTLDRFPRFDKSEVTFKTGKYSGFSNNHSDILPAWNIDEFTLVGSFESIDLNVQSETSIKTLIIEGDTFPKFISHNSEKSAIEKIIFKPVGCSQIRILDFDKDLFAPGITIEVPKDFKVITAKMFVEDLRKIVVKK